MTETINSSKLYFTSLGLENVRCFGEPQTLQLADANGIPAQWTMILGDNGVGKTTLLQCLARMRPMPARKDPQSEIFDCIEPELTSEPDNEELNRLVRAGPDVRLKLQAKMSAYQGFAKAQKNRKYFETHLRLERQANELEFAEPEGSSEIELINQPYLLGYGAGRHMGSARTEIDDFSDPLRSLFDANAPLLNVEFFLSVLDYGALKQKPGANNLRERLKTALATILPDISRPSHIKILGPRIDRKSKERIGVYFQTPYGEVRLSQLSFGYQTVSALITDMAWRMFDRYPRSPDPLAEPAVVLVDEIDLHLHPKWQRTMKEHLLSLFPKTQFICTAHSPLMAQTALDSNLVVLRQEDDQVVIENEITVVRDWRVDQILTSKLFELPSSRRPEVEKLFKKRDGLLDNPNRSSIEEKQLRKIQRQLQDLPTAERPKDQEAMEFIRGAAALLHRQTKAKL